MYFLLRVVKCQPNQILIILQLSGGGRAAVSLEMTYCKRSQVTAINYFYFQPFWCLPEMSGLKSQMNPDKSNSSLKLMKTSPSQLSH